MVEIPTLPFSPLNLAFWLYVAKILEVALNLAVAVINLAVVEINLAVNRYIVATYLSVAFQNSSGSRW